MVLGLIRYRGKRHIEWPHATPTTWRTTAAARRRICCYSCRRRWHREVWERAFATAFRRSLIICVCWFPARQLVQIGLERHAWRCQHWCRSKLVRNSRGATATRRLRSDWYRLGGVVVTAKPWCFCVAGTTAETTAAGGGWWWSGYRHVDAREMNSDEAGCETCQTRK